MPRHISPSMPKAFHFLSFSRARLARLGSDLRRGPSAWLKTRLRPRSVSKISAAGTTTDDDDADDN
eukprot:5425833-Heterocapsa_arctica.AAC.1